MNAFEIRGGKPLKGEIIPQGAKNEALQILSAVLLTSEKITVSNIPDIKDVVKLIELLGDLGVDVKRISKDTYEFQATNINLDFFQSQTFRRLPGAYRSGTVHHHWYNYYWPSPGTAAGGYPQWNNRMRSFYFFATASAYLFGLVPALHGRY